MGHLIYAHDGARSDLGEFTPEKVIELLRQRWSGVEPRVGDVVRVDHPQTCLNPEEYFKVVAVRQHPGSGYSFRGERTCWFGLSALLEVKR